MDGYLNYQVASLGDTAINTSLFAPMEEVLPCIVNRLAEIEQRMLLQRYEIHALQAELEALRCETVMVG
jgi:hypothetical protein